MVRSITSQPTSFSRLCACEGEISWSMRITSADRSSRSRRSSSRLPSPKYAVLSNPARFCVNVATTSKPSVFASWRSSASEASNSRSLTLDNCTAATMARGDFWATSCVMVHGAYQQSRPRLARQQSRCSGCSARLSSRCPTANERFSFVFLQLDQLDDCFQAPMDATRMQYLHENYDRK